MSKSKFLDDKKKVWEGTQVVSGNRTVRRTAKADTRAQAIAIMEATYGKEIREVREIK